MSENPIGAGVAFGFEQKTVQMREAYWDTTTEDKPFFAEAGATMLRNSFVSLLVVGF